MTADIVTVISVLVAFKCICFRPGMQVLWPVIDLDAGPAARRRPAGGPAAGHSDWLVGLSESDSDRHGDSHWHLGRVRATCHHTTVTVVTSPAPGSLAAGPGRRTQAASVTQPKMPASESPSDLNYSNKPF